MWGSYGTQTSNSYSGKSTPYVYAHVESRDAINNQSGWSVTDKIAIPTPTLFPTISVSGTYSEDVDNSCASMDVVSSGLTLQPTVPPYVTPVCTKTNSTYSCNFTIDNQNNPCATNSISIGIGGTYSGYNLSWRTGGDCSGAPVTISSSTSTPLYFQYSTTEQTGGWFKVSNASFTNRSTGSRNNIIPYNISAFDSSDSTATHNFSINSAGVINQQSLLNVGANALDTNGKPVYSTPNIYTSGYTQSDDVDYNRYTQYIKSRKGYTAIQNISGITGNGVYLISSSVTIADSTAFDGKNVVLVVDGNGSITISNDFTPTTSVALVAPTITLGGNVTKVNAVLVGKTIDTGTSVNPLKVSGNIVSQDVLTQGRTRSDSKKPSLFVDFEMAKFVDLLPYLSVSTYDWKQIQ